MAARCAWPQLLGRVQASRSAARRHALALHCKTLSQIRIKFEIFRRLVSTREQPNAQRRTHLTQRHEIRFTRRLRLAVQEISEILLQILDFIGKQPGTNLLANSTPTIHWNVRVDKSGDPFVEAKDDGIRGFTHSVQHQIAHESASKWRIQLQLNLKAKRRKIGVIGCRGRRARCVVRTR